MAGGAICAESQRGIVEGIQVQEGAWKSRIGVKAGDPREDGSQGEAEWTRRFELRLAATSPLPPAFAQIVHAAWALASVADKHPLEIVQVREIPRPPDRKFQAFTSDFMPELKPDDGA